MTSLQCTKRHQYPYACACLLAFLPSQVDWILSLLNLFRVSPFVCIAFPSPYLCCVPQVPCASVQIVKALESLLSKAAAATSPSPPQGATTAVTCPLQSPQHSLFQQRSQWPPLASADDLLDLVDFATGPLSASHTDYPLPHRLAPAAFVHRQQQQQTGSAYRASQAAERYCHWQ